MVKPAKSVYRLGSLCTGESSVCSLTTRCPKELLSLCKNTLHRALQPDFQNQHMLISRYYFTVILPRIISVERVGGHISCFKYHSEARSVKKVTF